MNDVLWRTHCEILQRAIFASSNFDRHGPKIHGSFYNSRIPRHLRYIYRFQEESIVIFPDVSKFESKTMGKWKRKSISSLLYLHDKLLQNLLERLQLYGSCDFPLLLLRCIGSIF